MIVSRLSVGALLVCNAILAASVINLQFFARQGKRYTWDNGEVERAERIQGDADLHARIDALHPPHWGNE